MFCKYGLGWFYRDGVKFSKFGVHHGWLCCYRSLVGRSMVSGLIWSMGFFPELMFEQFCVLKARFEQFGFVMAQYFNCCQIVALNTMGHCVQVQLNHLGS